MRGGYPTGQDGRSCGRRQAPPGSTDAVGPACPWLSGGRPAGTAAARHHSRSMPAEPRLQALVSGLLDLACGGPCPSSLAGGVQVVWRSGWRGSRGRGRGGSRPFWAMEARALGPPATPPEQPSSCSSPGRAGRPRQRAPSSVAVLSERPRPSTTLSGPQRLSAGQRRGRRRSRRSAPYGPDMTVVFDAGQNSEGNFAYLAGTGLHYVGSVPASDCPDLTGLPATVRSIAGQDRFGSAGGPP